MLTTLRVQFCFTKLLSNHQLQDKLTPNQLNVSILFLGTQSSI